jgi:hypothetical protein
MIVHGTNLHSESEIRFTCKPSLFASCYALWMVVFGHQHNNKNKNKPIKLLMLVLFDSCYMFRSMYGTIFSQSHQIHLLLLNCPNMDPYYCNSSQPHKTCNCPHCNQEQIRHKRPHSKEYTVHHKEKYKITETYQENKRELKTNNIIVNSFYNI